LVRAYEGVYVNIVYISHKETDWSSFYLLQTHLVDCNLLTPTICHALPLEHPQEEEKEKHANNKHM